jgi:rod shape-determining protein MreC
VLRKERDTRRLRFRGIATCVLIGILLGMWHNRQVSRGRSDIVTNSIRTVTSPFVNAASGVSGWFGRQFGWLFNGRSLAEENRRLHAENDQLRQENATLHEANITAQRLRLQLGFPAAPPAGKIPANIVSYRPYPGFETMVVTRGSRDGVALKSVVVSPTGLVGQVYDVAPTTCAVLLLTDSSSAVGAMVQRPESRATGVCKGNGSELLNLNYLSRDADVKVGDTIISSGLGGEKGVYPKGLPIGVVTKVTDDASGSTRLVTVKPTVNFGKLEEVYILKEPEPNPK